MDEMYRMLGSEHEKDLERAALSWHQARDVQRRSLRDRLHEPVRLVIARVAGLRGRTARAQLARLAPRMRR
jgi:hypothetical protein